MDPTTYVLQEDTRSLQYQIKVNYASYMGRSAPIWRKPCFQKPSLQNKDNNEDYSIPEYDTVQHGTESQDSEKCFPSIFRVVEELVRFSCTCLHYETADFPEAFHFFTSIHAAIAHNTGCLSVPL